MMTFGPQPFPELPRVAAPVGDKCLHCEEPIAEGDSGVMLPHMVSANEARIVALHRECHIRMIVGSVGHQRGLCTCDGGPGTMDDPPGATKREAAVLALREFLMQQCHA